MNETLTDKPVLGTSFNTGAGALIRDARQAQGLDIAALAAMLKVPVQKLQALEQEQFELLLDPVFVRALASSVCRILELDPAPVLQRLPAITAFKVLSQNRGINMPFRTRTGGHGASVWSHISPPAIWLGLALLLGALALIFLPVIQQEMSRYLTAAPSVISSGVLVEPASMTTAVTSQVTTDSDGPKAISNSTTPTLPPTEVQALISTPANFSAAPAQLPSLNIPPVNTNATITFSANGESWVNVTDAKGVVVLGRTLRAGETVNASGALPLNTVVGRSDVIQVQVRGQAFELAGVTKNNIARFEVK